MKLDHIAFRIEYNKGKDLRLALAFLGYEIDQSFKPFEDVYCDSYKHDTLPGVFVSEGKIGSIVARWVAENGQGIHHIAISTDNIIKLKEELSIEDALIECPGLKQVFSEPKCGVIIEILERDPSNPGFCEENVKKLMESTDG